MSFIVWYVSNVTSIYATPLQAARTRAVEAHTQGTGETDFILTGSGDVFLSCS